MLPNANSLLSSGTALVFKYLTQLQVDAAEMEITNQTFMQDMLRYEPELLKCSLDFADNQAQQQVASGWVQLGGALGEAVGTWGTMLLGDRLNTMPENTPQVQADLEPDEAPAAAVVDEDAMADFTLRGGIDNPPEAPGTAHITGRNTPAQQAAANTTANEETQDADQKALDKKIEAAQQRRNIVYQNFAPQIGKIVNGGFGTGNGYVQADATRDQAAVQFSQGLSQMAQGVVGQTSANIQSKEQLEKDAAQAFLQVEQLSASRA